MSRVCLVFHGRCQPCGRQVGNTLNGHKCVYMASGKYIYLPKAQDCCVTVCFFLSSLPEYFVVPSSLADQDLKIFSHSFVGRRMPVSDVCWISFTPMSFSSAQLSKGSASLLALVLEPLEWQCSCANGPHKRRAAAEKN